MTDHNRHAEPICDWSDLPTTGCAHCHGRHDNPEPLGVHTPPARPGRPVDLGSYRGEPYYRRAESLPTPDHGPICACGRPAGDAFVCPSCLDALEVHLGDVPALVEDLDIAAQKRDRVTVGTRRARMPQEPLAVLDGQWWTDEPSSGLLRDSGEDVTVTGEAVVADVTRRWSALLGRNRPDRAAAAAALDALHAELVAAVRVLLEPIGRRYDGDPSTVGLSRWLLGNVASIRLNLAGVDIASGLGRVHRRAMSVIDNAPEKIWYGWCSTQMEDGSSCDAEILVAKGQQVWTCRKCGAEYWPDAMEDEREQRARDWVGDQILTVAEISAIFGRGRGSVFNSLRRAGVEPIGKRVVDGKRVDTYAGADYLRVAKLRPLGTMDAELKSGPDGASTPLLQA